MLIKLLSAADKHHLVALAKLMALADKPLLWDGQTPDEFTVNTNLNNLSIQKGESEVEIIRELERSAGDPPTISATVSSSMFTSMFSSSSGTSTVPSSVDVESRLIDVLKSFPLIKIKRPEGRVQAAIVVLKELLKDKKFELPATPKVVLFELLLIALRDGNISNIEWALLKEFQQHHQLDDFIFDDLLERAETLNREVNKTISIILE
ncbi:MULTISPECIES: hypothetical protein [unclassified Pseudomonas]|jgi:hypothetical protein|uniref:hypothetical protein n=1 Tax=unclassified Pseudomonas TaxID=196821 RepID=UPI0010563274|nr:hypothetical protein [Pseudomonas sp. MS-1(2024)]MEC4168013.1 hypothetical protein [Pseudomonas sp. MS-1(2024)]